MCFAYLLLTSHPKDKKGCEKKQKTKRGVKISEVIGALEQFAPLPLQESFDNAGLQVGLTEMQVSGALLCLDVTEEVVDEAVRLGCNLIVSHHPLIFHKLPRVSAESYIGRSVMKAIKHDVTIVSMHTNMDSALGGVNYKIAEKIALTDIHFLGEEKEACGVRGAIGVIGRLPQSLSSREFVSLVKERFHASCVSSNEPLSRPISRVAICGGAGAFLLDEAIKSGADAFITGEMRYNDYFDHNQQIQILVIGHYESEQFTPEVFRDILAPLGVECHITSIVTNPIHYL